MAQKLKQLHEEIQTCLQNKQQEEALQISEEALQTFPNNLRLHLQRAQALINLEKTKQALKHLLNVKEKYDQNQNYLCRLGQVYLKEKEFTKAKECFESSYALGSEDQPTLKGLANVASIELGIRLDKIEPLLKENQKEEAERELLSLFEQLALETIQPFEKNKITRLIKESKSETLFQKSLSLVASKPEIFTEQMLTNLIQLALNFRKKHDAEELNKHLLELSTINYNSAMIALKVLLQTETETLEKNVALIQSKLHDTDTLLFEIQVVFQIQGALQAYDKLKKLLSKEEISAHIGKLMSIFRNAGQAKEALAVLEGSFSFDTLPLHAKAAYLNALIQMGNYHQALSLLDGLVEREAPLMKIKLKLYYHLGEYSKVIDFLENNQSEVVSNENILIWSLFESGEIISLEQITHWAQILQLDQKTRKERTLNIRIFTDALLQIKNGSAQKDIFSYATHKVIQQYVNNLPCEKNSVESQIPKSIVQYWDEKIPPPYIEQITATFSSAQGYEYKLFSKMEALTYVRENFDRKYMRALQLCHHPAEQADYFRLLYLVKNGGIYADSDDMLTGNLDELLTYQEGLILYKEPCGVGNNFLACRAQHPILVAALQRATHNLHAKTQENIWTKTGPGLLISVLGEYLGYMEQNNLEPDVRILSREKILQNMVPHCTLPYKGGKKAWLSTLQTS